MDDAFGHRPGRQRLCRRHIRGIALIQQLPVLNDDQCVGRAQRSGRFPKRSTKQVQRTRVCSRGRAHGPVECWPRHIGKLNRQSRQHVELPSGNVGESTRAPHSWARTRSTRNWRATGPQHASRQIPFSQVSRRRRNGGTSRLSMATPAGNIQKPSTGRKPSTPPTIRLSPTTLRTPGGSRSPICSALRATDLNSALMRDSQ